MKPRTAPTVVGVGWYRREDWDRLRQIFPDGNELHDTYDEWLVDARRAEKSMRRAGHIVKRVAVDPEAVLNWCALRGFKPVAKARSQYVCEKLAEPSKAPMAR